MSEKYRMGRNGIPDRWLEYTNFGSQVQGTPFIAFKVPLKKEICPNLWKSEKRFSPLDLVESIPNLGMVIDLTNTARYYNGYEIQDLNVSYKKIKVIGHRIPDKSVVKRFTAIVEKFRKNEENKDRLIGVHCTHGVNRSGYMLCRYMINRMGFSAETAIEEVGKARGYSIERENYLEDLRSPVLHSCRESSGDDLDEEPQPRYRNYKAQTNNWRKPVDQLWWRRNEEYGVEPTTERRGNGTSSYNRYWDMQWSTRGQSNYRRRWEYYGHEEPQPRYGNYKVKTNYWRKPVDQLWWRRNEEYGVEPTTKRRGNRTSSYNRDWDMQ